MASAVIQTGTSPSINVIINMHASVDNYCDIEFHSHITPGTTVSGDVALKSRIHVGTGASIIQGVRIEKRSVAGAGAVVIEDMPSETVVFDVPAHPK
ncbi:hypothetical protein [Salinibacter ruber]|uniref:hypothetical protein n=1 Tax=Salinibacter ruber TaxID=146919 RepID=UPI002073253B|nr:hypothetical protein [Salinibacter ruber]